MFQVSRNIPTDRITSLYLTVISTQHKINYTYIKRISHSKPFRHQNDPLYIGNLWAKSALYNGWEGKILGGGFIQVEAKKIQFDINEKEQNHNTYSEANRQFIITHKICN